MYTKKRYAFWMTLNWSKGPLIYGSLYTALICGISYVLQLNIALPWQPIGVIGTAVAFYLGFKNNSSYDRTWEARKIWGGIVNSSRSFGAAVISFVQGPNAEEIQKELIYRHLAWLTSLRHQLRLSQEWEHTEDRVKGLYSPVICEDYHNKLDAELAVLISEEEINELEEKANTATQILALQSKRLQALKDKGYFEDFRHMEFHALLRSFYDEQGKSERIKNFPFPRQYASTAVWMTMVFSALLPFAMLDIISQENLVLFCISPLISGLLIWIFFLMEKIGDYSENPFEGTYNDVPISAISRGIEIDLREMLNETDVPSPFKSRDGFLL